MKKRKNNRNHLTFDELAEYLSIDIDSRFTKKKVRLMEKVSNHFEECDQCVKIFNELMMRHAFAEFIMGEEMPLRPHKTFRKFLHRFRWFLSNLFCWDILYRPKN